MATKVYKPEYPGLYYFDTFTFTTLGTSGHRGPDSTKGYANAPWNPDQFSIVDGQQQWTVPATGTYNIVAAGAYGATPGRVVSGDVDLSEGQVLTMIVGQMPTPLVANVADNVTVGGGGGTFIVSDGKPLIVASGGDGGSYKNEGYDERKSFADPTALFASVSVSGDGTTMAGIAVDVNTFAATTGIYTYTNGFWVLETTLDATIDLSKQNIIEMSGNGKTVAICTPTIYIRIFELQNDGTWQKTTIPALYSLYSYNPISLSYDGKTLFTQYPGVYTSGTSWSTLTPLAMPVEITNPAWTTVAMSGDGQTFCIGFDTGSSGTNNLYVYDGIGGTPVLLETGPGESPSSISCSYDGSVIATVNYAAYTYYPRVRVFTNRVLSKTFELTEQTYAIAIVQLTSDGSKLLVTQSFQVSIDDTVLSTRVNQLDLPVSAMNADGSRIVSSYVTLTTPGLFTYNYTSGPSPATFLPSGAGQGIAGAGYLTDGEATNPYFNFFKPNAYVDGGFGNQYEYGSVPYQGGFGGGQSPLNKRTDITSITGYKQVRPTLQFSGIYNILESFAINQDGTLFLLKNVGNYNSYVNVYAYQDSSWVATTLYTDPRYPNAVNNVAMSLQGDVWLLGGDVWRNGTFETHLEDLYERDSGTYPRRICETSISSDGNVVAMCTQDINAIKSYCNVYMYSSGTWSKTLSVPIAYLDFYISYTPGCALSGDGKTLCVEFRAREHQFPGNLPSTNFVYTSKYANGSWSSPTLISKKLDDPLSATLNPFYCQVDVNSDGSKIISVNNNFEYSNGVFSPLISPSLKFSKTDPNAYAYTDGVFIYAPFASLKIKVNLNASNYLLDFGSSILAVSDSGNYSPQNICFVDMYDPTTTCTATTSIDHGYPYDYEVQITGTNSFNGTWLITAVSSNTFTFQAFGGPTETTGYVSGTTTGISGGGGYTGSAGDGVSGATCYADESVVNFTDLGATGNTAGTVTISLIDPVPLKQTWTWDQTLTSTAPQVPYETINWFDKLQIFQSETGTSSDGIHWDAITVYDIANGSGSARFYSAYSETLNLYVAFQFGANFENILYVTSNDGVTWNETTPVGLDINDLTPFANGSSMLWAPELGLFVLAGSRKISSSTDGINWTLRYSDDPGVSMRSIAYSPSLHTFVCCNDTESLGYAGIYSTDGVTWNTWSVDGPFPSIGWTVTWSPKLGIFVAAVNFLEATTFGEPPDTYEGYIYYSNIAHSTDGQTWSVAGFNAPTVTDRFWNVIWGEGLDVFTSIPIYSGDNYNMYSYDGITWKTTTSQVFGQIAYSPTKQIFVVTSDFDGGYTQFISIEGIYYVNIGPVYPSVKDFTWCPQLGKFLTYNFSTSDCVRWEQNDTSIPEYYGKPVWSPELGLFVILKLPFYYYSYDGTTWVGAEFNPPLPPSVFLLPCVAWSPTLGVFSGSFYSRDGKNWTLPLNFTAIGWSSFYNMFVAFNDTSAYYSYDGINWNTGTNDTEIQGEGDVVCSSSGRIICPGKYTGVLYSDDGINWQFSDTIGFLLRSPLWINELSIFVGSDRTQDPTIGCVSTDGINWTTNYIQTNAWSPELGRFLCTGGYSQVTKTF